jgi:tetratricopeptide (TPR) repeat protein
MGMRWMAVVLLALLLAPCDALAASAELLQRLDALYARRDDPQAADEFDRALAPELAGNPDDYEILWRASRRKAWLAEVAPAPQGEMLGKEAWDLGERAVKLDPARVEGQYFAAIGLGLYAQSIGMLKALRMGADGKFTERIDAAIRINPGFLFGAPLVVKGRYWFQVPWPMRDLKKSRQEYERAIAEHPENLRAYVYLAETLLRDGDKEPAKQALQKVETGSVDYDPPEARRSQALASALLKSL